MKTLDFLKERVVFLLVNMVLVFTLIIFLYYIGIYTYILLFVFCLWFLPMLSSLILEYVKRNNYYNNLLKKLEGLDRKYLLSEIITEPEFMDGKILYEIITVTNRDMLEHIKEFSEQQREYKKYIESWVHEIKTPIACGKLIIENNKNETTRKIEEELNDIEEYVEQVLYYARSTDVNKDYIIKKFKLKESVKNVVKKNSRTFIYKNIKLDLKSLDYEIYNDTKWVEFIINQIIINSIKYSKKENPQISIYAKKNKNNVTLIIEDNGIGISESDLKKVFSKGFTGENGRMYGKSTGMGLYICSNLSKKLGLGIEITSKKLLGTKVSIIFPMGNFSHMEQ